MSRPNTSFTEICELCVLGALGWFLGLWVLKGLSMPPALGSTLLAVALLWVGIGFGETVCQGILRLAGGGGWFLLLSAGPLAALNWLILWVVPTASRDRLGIVLGAIAIAVSLVLLGLHWMHRDSP